MRPGCPAASRRSRAPRGVVHTSVHTALGVSPVVGIFEQGQVICPSSTISAVVVARARAARRAPHHVAHAGLALLQVPPEMPLDGDPGGPMALMVEVGRRETASDTLPDLRPQGPSAGDVEHTLGEAVAAS